MNFTWNRLSTKLHFSLSSPVISTRVILLHDNSVRWMLVMNINVQ